MQRRKDADFSLSGLEDRAAAGSGEDRAALATRTWPICAPRSSRRWWTWCSTACAPACAFSARNMARPSRWSPPAASPPTRRSARCCIAWRSSSGTVLVAPPLELCTDNGAMIAWAGCERLALGMTDSLDVAPRARWPLDEIAAAKGALQAHGGVQMTIQKISVLGGGAWGTALALTCARVGRDVTLWEHDAANADSLAAEAREPLPARREARRQDQAHARSGRGGGKRRHPAGGAGAGAARGGDGAGAVAQSAHAAGRLRQGHRARHATNS